MEITLKNTAESKKIFAEHGSNIAALLEIDNEADVVFSIVSKGLFGSKGHIFTEKEYISFKADKKFGKLKDRTALSYNAITDVAFDDSSYYMDWTFTGEGEDLRIWFEYFEGQGGFSQTDLFWYDREQFADLSSGVYAMLKALSSGSNLKNGEETLAAAKDKINSTLSSFSRKDFREAAALFLLASCHANESNKNSYLDVFHSLDTCYAALLKQARVDLATLSRALSTENAIYEVDEYFQELSAAWYLRNMAAINFAEKFTEPEKIKLWSYSVVKTRASVIGERMKIDIPDASILDEQIVILED